MRLQVRKRDESPFLAMADVPAAIASTPGVTRSLPSAWLRASGRVLFDINQIRPLPGPYQ
jgi:hypothetical protein